MARPAPSLLPEGDHLTRHSRDPFAVGAGKPNCGERKIVAEREAGRLNGPLLAPRTPLIHTSPLGLVPKKPPDLCSA